MNPEGSTSIVGKGERGAEGAGGAEGAEGAGEAGGAGGAGGAGEDGEDCVGAGFTTIFLVAPRCNSRPPRLYEGRMTKDK
ncbi:hypothetical protein [Coleofasciculus sp. G2-EDA-02]|uniref:hypothetical protein n=1 Tax=Coleofasciculus sp. G2-EDA-02 TaxID=3069529 RepID=UPI0032F33D42